MPQLRSSTKRGGATKPRTLAPKNTQGQNLSEKEKQLLSKVVPLENPPFTFKDIKDAIPAHCWERSYVKSFGYLAVNLLCVAAAFWVSLQFDNPIVSPRMKYVLWPLYWLVQGSFGWGIWVIAHECGHGSFSPSRLVNDIVGLFLHTCVFVPYFSWQHTHAVHHKNCGSMEHDTAFVPDYKEEYEEKHNDNPIRFTLPFIFVKVLMYVFLGWPLYLFFHIEGGRFTKRTCHFDPYAEFFGPKQRLKVIINDIALLALAFGLYQLSTIYGGAYIMCVFVLPVMVTNGWLVITTKLHHSHPDVPHFDSKEWTWLRGALSTVDRDYGFVFNKMFHHINDTHVLHHLFSIIPFYHAEEASAAIKPVLGQYYRCDHTNFLRAFYDSLNQCSFVEPIENIHFWKSSSEESAKKC